MKHIVKSLRPLRPLCALALLTACVNPTKAPPILPEVPIESTTFATSLGVNLATSTKVNGVYVRDIVVGTGAAVQPGQSLAMHYSGYLANGTLFDSNTGNTPFVFQLNRGQVISGWDIGIQGMNVGGKRQLIIPPSLGYGTTPVTGIPQNSVLVFNVEVVSAQ